MMFHNEMICWGPKSDTEVQAYKGDYYGGFSGERGLEAYQAEGIAYLPAISTARIDQRKDIHHVYSDVSVHNGSYRFEFLESVNAQNPYAAQ
jgi:hypothetical protein